MEAEDLLKGVLEDMGVIINYEPEAETPIQKIFDWVESMRCSLWDTAFFREFKGDNGVHKNKTSAEMPNFKQACRRVLYRYFKYILYPRKATSKVPAFFGNYLDITSSECMYTPAILKAWDRVHYDSCGWYMDCAVSKCPPFDIALRDSLQPVLSNLPARTPPEAEAPSPEVRKGRARKSQKAGGRKRKATDAEEEDADDDIVATDAASSERTVMVPPHPGSTSVEAGPQLKKRPPISPPQSALVAPLTVPASKTLSVSNAFSSSVHSSSVLVLNDSFPRMAELRMKTKKFPESYDSMVAFLIKVTSAQLISTPCIRQ